LEQIQAPRDNLAKNGGTPEQLQMLDNRIGILKTNLDALDKHKASVTGKTSRHSWMWRTTLKIRLLLREVLQRKER